jgi:hypothetical protein
MNTRLRKGSRCTSCQEGRLVPIIYGLPTNETVEQYREGKVEIGGCIVREVFDEERGEFVSADPQLSCPQCGGKFLRDGRRGS